MGRDRREDEGQYYPGGKTIPATPQRGGGSVVLDDTVTQTSQNGVKSSGIWSWVKSLLPAWLTPGYAEPATVASVENKVDKVPGKGLSTNDYTTAEKTTLATVLTTLASIDAKTDGKLDKSGGTMTGPLVIQVSDGSEMEIGFGGFTLWYGPNRLIRRDLSFPNLVGVDRPTTDDIVATHDLIEALPYRLNMSATIVDRAINVVTSGAFVIPEGFKDLLIRYTGTPTSLTFSGADASITDWGDDLPTDSGDYLITVSRIAADEAYIRIIKLEARA